MVGAFIPPSWNYAEDITSFDNLTGKRHTHVMIFCSFDYDFWNGPYLLQQIGETGKSPVICWQSGVEGVPDRAFSNASFIRREHDEGIIRMALHVRRFIREFKIPVYMRWAHEANISSAPAWPGHPWNNRSVDEYIHMFRYVHDLFYSQLSPAEAAKVIWTWSVNYLGAAEGLDSYSDWRNLYPGDKYVEMMGLSGLNYGAHPTAGPGFSVNVQWLYLPILRDMMAGKYSRNSVREVSLRDLAALSGGKPQGIFEFGSVDVPPSYAKAHGAVMPEYFSEIPKEDWIRQGYDALARMEEFRYVRLVLWYNDIAASGGFLSDYRVARNPNREGESPVPERVTRAYAEAVADPFFKENIMDIDEITPSGYYSAASLPRPASYPQHELWLSVRPGGMVSRGSTISAAYFLYPPNGGNGSCSAYLAARTPSGDYYALVPPKRWVHFSPSSEGVPAAIEKLDVTREVRGTAFVLALKPGLPEGRYTFYSILVKPGADPRKGGPDLKVTDFNLAD